ncbi:class I SAM-dependent methyltransferase [Streptomyces diacarni]|uniref:class I SAM-dependent methyltransferase n=1 Tax=Streptomyces diacarni TaxID=2800381 RepID=UPI0033FA25A3
MNVTFDYDKLATAYAAHRTPYGGLLGALIRRAHEKDAVLELGCGSANHLLRIAEATSARCVGLDSSVGMLGQARARGGERIELVHSDATATSLPPASFGLIYSVDVIHHVREVHAYFAEVARLLQPGGLVCTVTDSEEMIRSREALSGYFPGTVPFELGRYHAFPVLREAEQSAGLTPTATEQYSEPWQITDTQLFQDKAYSCLHGITEAEHRRGVEAMKEALRRGPIEGRRRSCALWAVKPNE